MLLLATAAGSAFAGCEAAAHREFDFWVGEWDVYGRDGRRVGTNTIESILDGCAMIERWTDAAGSEGSSLIFYDRVAKHWKMVWVTDTGGVKEKTGGWTEGRMRLRGDVPQADGSVVPDRTTWEPRDDGSVRQTIEVSNDGGARWRTVFDAIYRRAGGEDRAPAREGSY